MEESITVHHSKKKTTNLCEFVKGNVQKVYICGDSPMNQRLIA